MISLCRQVTLLLPTQSMENTNAVHDIEVKKRKVHSSSPGPASSSRPVSCPVCKQSVGCQRFAYHLQKCMGGGSRKSSQDRRRKLNAQNSAQESAGADQSVSQKISRLEADKEYFSKKPVIVKIRLNEKGNKDIMKRESMCTNFSHTVRCPDRETTPPNIFT